MGSARTKHGLELATDYELVTIKYKNNLTIRKREYYEPSNSYLDNISFSFSFLIFLNTYAHFIKTMSTSLISSTETGSIESSNLKFLTRLLHNPLKYQILKSLQPLSSNLPLLSKSQQKDQVLYFLIFSRLYYIRTYILFSFISQHIYCLKDSKFSSCF